jgi:hypothetical protein
MSAIDPGAAARQGFLLSPIYIAVQGLIAFIAGGGQILTHMRRRGRR